MHTITATSPAKLNLFLHITGKRPDGYHLLESLFIKLQLADSITITSSDDLTCTTIQNGTELYIEGNLALKAAQLLQNLHNIKQGATINIEKRIPMQAGLGGASSNAATVLLLLNQLWNLNLSNATLQEYALSLGADVPFFVQPAKIAFVHGIGEKIIPITSYLGISIPCLIAHPDIGISTIDVYKKGVTSFKLSILHNVQCKLGKNLLDFLIKLVYKSDNSLYEPASHLYPELSQVMEELSKLNGCMVVRMSGSGSACFALFQNARQMQEAKECLLFPHHQWTLHSEILAV